MCFFEAMFRTKTKPRSDRNNLKKGFISAVLFMGWVLLAQSAHGYGVDQHLSIGSDALSLYDSNAPTQHWAGADGVRICWNHFAYMLHHEDDAPNWLQHFWNPDGGDNDGLWLNDSAYTRASNFLSNYRNRPVKCIFRVFPFIETIPPWHETEERCDGGNESGGILAGACGTVACKRGLDSGVLPWAGDFGAGVSFLETGAPAP